MPDDKGEMVLRVINGAEAANLDPVQRKGIPGTHILVNMFEGLLRIDNKTGGYLPGVAEKWNISEDGKKYTFNLRKSAMWSDGKSVTAKDFVDSYRRALDPISQSVNASLFFIIKNAEDVSLKKKEPQELGIIALNQKTLQIELEHSAGYFLSLLSLVPFYATPSHVIKEHNNDWTNKEHIVSNGPFKLSFRRRNDRTELVKNDLYWGKNDVKLDKIIFFTNDNDATSLRLFKSHGADHHVTGIASAAYPGILKNPEWVTSPRIGTYYYSFNTKEAPFNNPKVRQAISLAIDREKLTKGLRKGQTPAYFLIPPRTNNYKAATKLEENIKKAKKLLKEAGYENPEDVPPLTILYNKLGEHRLVAIFISDMLKENLGLKVKMENLDWKTFLSRRNHGDYQIARDGWIGDYNDPHTFLELLYSGSDNNNTFWKNEKYDALYFEYQKTINPQKRLELMQKAEKIILEEMPLMPLFFYMSDTLTKPYVKNLYPRSKKDVEQGFYDLQSRAVLRDVYIDLEEKKKYFATH